MAYLTRTEDGERADGVVQLELTTSLAQLAGPLETAVRMTEVARNLYERRRRSHL
jgi:hypothetical protein